MIAIVGSDEEKYKMVQSLMSEAKTRAIEITNRNKAQAIEGKPPGLAAHAMVMPFLGEASGSKIESRNKSGYENRKRKKCNF